MAPLTCPIAGLPVTPTANAIRSNQLLVPTISISRDDPSGHGHLGARARGAQDRRRTAHRRTRDRTADPQDAITQIGATGAPDRAASPPSGGSGPSIALIGVGPEATPDTLRLAAGSAARQLTGVDRIAIALPVEVPEDAAAVLEGAAIGAYAFTGYAPTPLARRDQDPAADIVAHPAASRPTRMPS
ncbi:MAG: M17 family peptidase N-terminal domain-containing protein [Schumannella sp.]